MPKLFKRILNRSLDVLFLGPLLDRTWANRLRGKALCLCYHRVDDPKNHSFLTEGGVPAIPPEALKNDIRSLKKFGFDFITFDDLRNKGLDPRRPHVILSFDDGYKDNYTHGQSILQEAGVRGVLFQTTSMVNSEDLLWEHAIFWHCRNPESLGRFRELARRALPEDPAISQKENCPLAYHLIEHLPYEQTQKVLDEVRKALPAGEERRIAADIYPTEQDIKAAHTAGHEIACHGHLHYKRSGVTPEMFERDLELSSKKLRSWTGRDTLTYAYPHGNYAEGDEAICAKYFKNAVTVKPGVIRADSDRFSLPRIYWAGPPKHEVRRKRWLLTGAF